MRNDNLCTAGYDEFEDLHQFQDSKRRMFNEVNPVGKGRCEFADCDFDSLLNLHDDATDCEDYEWAAKIDSAIKARPEYPAYKADMDHLFKSFEPLQPSNDDVPF